MVDNKILIDDDLLCVKKLHWGVTAALQEMLTFREVKHLSRISKLTNNLIKINERQDECFNAE